MWSPPSRYEDIEKVFFPENSKQKVYGFYVVMVFGVPPIVGIFFCLGVSKLTLFSIPIIVPFALTIWYFISKWVLRLWYWLFPWKNLLVVISNFEPINEEAKSHSEIISERLEVEIRERIKPDVPLEFLKRHTQVIKGNSEEEKKETAKKIGKDKYGAHLVIWGSVGSTKTKNGKEEFYFEPRITVVHPLGPTKLEERQPEKLDAFLSEPEILELRRRKIEETADMVSFIHGLAIYKQGDFQGTINIFKEIKNPDAEVCFYHGTALLPLSRFDEAIEQFDKAVKINPHLTGVWKNMGVAFDKLGKHEEAIACFAKVLEINPQDAKAWRNKGVAFCNLGKYEEAINCYDKAIEINPRYAVAYVNRGTAYSDKGEYDLAISNYNKAIEINTRYAVAYVNRGSAYYSNGEYDRAIGDFSKALEINPRDDKAYNNRAVVYYFKRDFDKAWEDVHKAQGLGCQVPPEFLDALRQASGRDK